MRIIQHTFLALIVFTGLTLKAEACFDGYLPENFLINSPGLPNPLFKKNLNLTQ